MKLGIFHSPANFVRLGSHPPTAVTTIHAPPSDPKRPISLPNPQFKNVVGSKSLLSLAAILDEYITLKEQKVWVDQERRRLEQEKLRVQNLLSGMQDVMNAYNAIGNDPPPPLPPPAFASVAMASLAELAAGRPAGKTRPALPDCFPWLLLLESILSRRDKTISSVANSRSLFDS